MLSEAVICERIRAAYPHAPFNFIAVSELWSALLQKEELSFEDASGLDELTGTDNFVLQKIFERAGNSPIEAFELWLRFDLDLIKEIYSDLQIGDAVYSDLVGWAGRRIDEVEDELDLQY